MWEHEDIEPFSRTDSLFKAVADRQDMTAHRIMGVMGETELFNALTTAAEKGRVDVVSMILESWDFHHKDLYKVGLAAYGCGQRDVVSLLMELYKDENFMLVRAAHCGDIEVVSDMLNRGANILMGYALENASRKGHLPVVQLLIDHGAHELMIMPFRTTAGEVSIVHAALAGFAKVVRALLIHVPYKSAQTAMVSAKMRGHETVITMLQKYGVKEATFT